MSYWVEVHCDVLSVTPDPAHPHGLQCYTHNNDNPAAKGRSHANAVRNAESEAQARGWKRRRMTPLNVTYLGWVCPHCQRFPPEASADAET